MKLEITPQPQMPTPSVQCSNCGSDNLSPCAVSQTRPGLMVTSRFGGQRLVADQTRMGAIATCFDCGFQNKLAIRTAGKGGPEPEPNTRFSVAG